MERTWLPADSQDAPGQLEAPCPSPVPGMYVLPTIPTVGAIFKDAALREQSVAEIIWTVYVTELS